jgi:hypothetical protein
MAEKILSQEYLHQLFEYRNGDLYRKIKKSPNAMPGQKAGTLQKNGYFAICIDRKRQYIHRIVFMMHYGYMPKTIDHIDGNSKNNQIENLRDVTHSQNICNQKLRSDNKSGIKGIGWHKAANKWRAVIAFEKTQYHLGLFENIKDAEKAIHQKRIELHKDFARHL